jgi:hypothetical protein
VSIENHWLVYERWSAWPGFSSTGIARGVQILRFGTIVNGNFDASISGEEGANAALDGRGTNELTADKIRDIAMT